MGRRRHYPERSSMAWLAVAVAVGLSQGCVPSPIRPNGVHEIRMASVPAGWFVMGSDTGRPASRPAHRIYLSDFEIGLTEVTNEQFREYAETSGRVPRVWEGGVPALRPTHPAAGILWEEAAAFCRWYGWRLPTEAEWEKAARGTDQRTYPWGDEWDPTLANISESGRADLEDVGSHPAGRSPYGALDMTGNVQEWVADYFDPTYYLHSPLRDPRGPSQILDHGLRGGSWASPREHSTTFFRDSSHSARPNARVGFRCAADPQQP